MEGGINLFTYTGNNPINYIDPEGEFFFLLVAPAAYTGAMALADLAMMGGLWWSTKEALNWFLKDTGSGSSRHQPCRLAGETSPKTPDPDDSEFLKELERVKSKGSRKRWVDSKGRIYEWDSRHGELEVYDKQGRHIGVRDPRTGDWTKPRVPGRRIEP